jgi:pyruvate,orthophosphate dikinase
VKKWIYSFGDGKAEGSAKMIDLLGGKGANLAEMSNLGLPVPSGFTITSEVCTYFIENTEKYPEDLLDNLNQALLAIEISLGKAFGSSKNPLLVSVRSGSRASMPGMLDTVLNIGLNNITVEGLIKESSDERFAYDSYRRFIQMYGDVVLGVDSHYFEDLLEDYKADRGVELDTELVASDLIKLVDDFLSKVKEINGSPFPQDPIVQLWGAISAVFGSWMNDRAQTFRHLNAIPFDWGTAVNVQAMVFGNMGNDCATGVCFTRDPSTGENNFYGEYLVNAQGEDVVSGIRTPNPLTEKGRKQSAPNLDSMETSLPKTFSDLSNVRYRLESHFLDMQDIEFTVECSKLWILQTRTGKRTTNAALKIAIDMVKEGLIDKIEAVRRIDVLQLEQLLHPTIDVSAKRNILGYGLPASPGVASGRIIFNSADAENWVRRNEKVILVRKETKPEDIGGMHVSEGVLTSRGGMTSHAAVVARGMGIPCVSGAGCLNIDTKSKILVANGKELNEGDTITVDGSTGEIIFGKIPMVQPELTDDFATLMEWVDEIRTLGVRANAETPIDALTALKFGAEGIGLTKTEHMFFNPERLIYTRHMILAKDEAQRKIALENLLPFQRKDFVDLFSVLNGLPVTIRLLDPPLNDFLPYTEEDISDVAKVVGISFVDVKKRLDNLDETNPMLGHSGFSLGVAYPEIYEMQVRAIFEAVADVLRDGISVKPEIMIPLDSVKFELTLLKGLIEKVAKQVGSANRIDFDYLIGAMIELPRAAIKAGEIDEKVELFSFGTNDLTQTTFGLSGEELGNFLEVYHRKEILFKDPIASIDQDAVRELMRFGADRGRDARPYLKIGICNEHGADPESINFYHETGLDYISCSPHRVPIARLAAAQAAIQQSKSF